MAAERLTPEQIAFLHGASLPGPEHELQGAGKAKRRLSIRTLEDLERPAVGDLIRAAVEREQAA